MVSFVSSILEWLIGPSAVILVTLLCVDGMIGMGATQYRMANGILPLLLLIRIRITIIINYSYHSHLLREHSVRFEESQGVREIELFRDGAVAEAAVKDSRALSFQTRCPPASRGSELQEMAPVGPGDRAHDDQGGQDKSCPGRNDRGDAGQSQKINACRTTPPADAKHLKLHNSRRWVGHHSG